MGNRLRVIHSMCKVLEDGREKNYQSNKGYIMYKSYHNVVQKGMFALKGVQDALELYK